MTDSPRRSKYLLLPARWAKVLRAAESTASTSSQSRWRSGSIRVSKVSISGYSYSGLALDFQSRQTGTMSEYSEQELAPITICSAGQPPKQPVDLHPPQLSSISGKLNRSNSLLLVSRLSRTWLPSIRAKYESVSNRYEQT